MKVSLLLAMTLAALAGLAAGAARCVTRNDEAANPNADEEWSTKKVMRKIHSGKQALLSVVRADLQKAQPDWVTDEKGLAEINRLMSTLTGRKPLRGSQDAWDKLVRAYVDQVKVAQQSVKEHKLLPARAALKEVSLTCEKCHDDHGVQ